MANYEPARHGRLQHATGNTVKCAWADQGYTCKEAGRQAAEHDIELQVVKLAEPKKGFVLLPRHWVVERLPEVLAGLDFVVFAMLIPHKAALLLAVQWTHKTPYVN